MSLIKPRGAARQAKSFTVPAPVRGWNARDPIASMKPTDALVLENFFPRAGNVELRKGCLTWQQNFNEEMGTLMEWSGATAKLFAASPTGIFDVTAQSTSHSAAVELCNSSDFAWTTFETSGGHFLLAANGVDALKLYDGTTWKALTAVSSPAITGVVTSDITAIAVMQDRLWFAAKNSSTAYYLPVKQIAGAVGTLTLGSVFTKGGSLVAMGAWTVDGGDGMDDYSVFVSSKGEVIVYKGSDPSVSTSWMRVGTYSLGEPMGRNCLAKFGGDLLMLTQAGLFPLSKALLSTTVNRDSAISTRIVDAFAAATSTFAHLPNWQIVVYPVGSFLFVNVPVSTTNSQQFVMNTSTNAWCKFTNWNAKSWITFGRDLYFTTSDKVVKAWTGSTDFGASLFGKAQSAYSYLGRQASKHIKLVRPLLTVDADTVLRFGIDVDYSVNFFETVSINPVVTNSLWDSAKWDEAVWDSARASKRDWLTVFSNPCYAAAFRLQCTSASVNLTWAATDFIYEPGGML